MAEYTESIREIMQENMTPQQHLTNINDVNTIAKACIFDESPVDLINDVHRDRFITGFALHFMDDEIGWDNRSRWKIALNEKLVTSYDYINKIFDNLDKQIFANYNVKEVESEGTADSNKDITGSQNTVNNGTDESVRTYSENNGEDRKDTMSKDGKTTLTKKGSEYNSRGGYDDLEKMGAESQINSGSDITYDDGVQDAISSKESGNYINAIQINADTPMGSVKNLRSPGGPTSETASQSESFEEGRDMDIYQEGGNRGYNYEANQVYNYMSSASESGQTTQNVENGNDKSINHNQSTTEHGLEVATVYGKDSKYAKPRIDRNDYHSNESTTYGYKVEASGAVNADPRIDETEEKSNDTLESKIDRDKTGNDEITRNTSNTVDSSNTGNEKSNASHEDSTHEVDYSLNWEMLYKSMPLLNKVWEIFDDLFMIIF